MYLSTLLLSATVFSTQIAHRISVFALPPPGLLGGFDTPFPDDTDFPNDDTFSTVNPNAHDRPRSLKECTEFTLAGNALSVTCAVGTPQTQQVLTVTIDNRIGSRSGFLIYKDGGSLFETCTACEVSEDLDLTCVCQTGVGVVQRETKLNLEVVVDPTTGATGAGVFYTLAGLIQCVPT